MGSIRKVWFVFFLPCMVVLWNDQPLSAEDVIEQVRELIRSKRVTGADYVRIGEAFLQQGNLKSAMDAFKKSVQLGSRVQGYHGIGKVFAQMPGRGVKAQYYFHRALGEDATFSESQYHLGLLYKRIRPLEAFKAFEKATEMAPTHADAFYQMGRLLEEKGDHAEAVAAYEQQLAVYSPHGEVRYRLGRMRFAEGRYSEAVELFAGLVVLEGDMATKAYLEMAVMSQMARDFDQAQKLFDAYIKRLPENEQQVFFDISLVANDQEQTLLKALPVEERKKAQRRFWNSKDPAPLTPANERLIEHYRRVAYARASFSEGAFPFDDRGEIYVRLGPPDHISRFDDIQAELDAQLLLARERFAARLLPGLIPPAGRPIFPIDGRWEYWVYANIDEGTEFTFENEFYDGRYRFADIPLRSFGAGRIGDLVNVHGEMVIRNIAAITPSLYRADFADLPIDFYYYPAGFRGDNDQTKLELYLGLPASEVARLPVSQGDALVVLERGVVLYDSLWNEVHRVNDRLTFRTPSDQQIQDGAFIPGVMPVVLSAGRYYMSLQVRDVISGKSQVYQQVIELDNYARDAELKMSDIELAFVVAPTQQEGQFVKRGLRVVPMSSKSFRRDQNAYVYFEIYNLMRDAFGQSQYRVEYTVRSYKERGVPAKVLHGLGRLLRLVEKEQQVEIAYDQVGQTEDEVAYVELDLRETEPGEQLVFVTVTDLQTEQSKSKQIRFKIVP